MFFGGCIEVFGGKNMYTEFDVDIVTTPNQLFIDSKYMHETRMRDDKPGLQFFRYSFCIGASNERNVSCSFKMLVGQDRVSH